MLPPLQVAFDSLYADVSLLSSIAIILGAVFVVFEIRDNKKLIEAAYKQANSSADQAKLTTRQLEQNYELATVNLVTGIYEFANSLEVQKSWKTVRDTNLGSFADFEKLPEENKLAYQQIASLFESLGLLVEKKFVKAELVDDMFSISLAWTKLKPFTMGLREKYPGEEYYVWFQKLRDQLSGDL